MSKNILNLIAYQRYATQSLHNALIQKRKAVQTFDQEQSEMCDVLIMNMVRDIQSARSKLENLVGDMPLAVRIAGMNDADAAIFTEILADIAKQEAFCRQELSEVHVQSASICFASINSRPAASATLQ